MIFGYEYSKAKDCKCCELKHYKDAHPLGFRVGICLLTARRLNDQFAPIKDGYINKDCPLKNGPMIFMLEDSPWVQNHQE
jgi:hypothetical protein